MVEETRAQLARWRPGDRLDLAHEMMELTLAIVGRTIFGVDIRRDAQVVGEALEVAMRSVIGSLTSPLPRDRQVPRQREMKRAVKQLDDVVFKLIADGRRLGTDRGDVLSMLLLARDDEGGTFTDRGVIPPRSNVVINIRGIHRRADYFPAPLAFRPERMLPEAKKARPRHWYLPFGAGPRVCIGQHFALMEAQLVLATMVQQARIRPLASYVAPEPLVTLRPRGGLPALVSLPS